MVRHAKESKSKEFIVGTEKKFYPVPHAVCPNIKNNHRESNKKP